MKYRAGLMLAGFFLIEKHTGIAKNNRKKEKNAEKSHLLLMYIHLFLIK